MDVNSISNVFIPLANRLYLYESEKYLDNNPFTGHMEEDYPFDSPYEYELVLDEIEKSLTRYDPLEVYREASFYLGRVILMIKNLKKMTHKGIWNVDDVFETAEISTPVPKLIPLTIEEQNSLFESWMRELTYTQNILERIMNVRRHVVTPVTSEKVDSIVEINLPERLPLKTITKHYQAHFSPTQAAILMQYLQDLKAIPPYTKTDIGRLGEFMFACNKKGISDGLTLLENEEVDLKDLEHIRDTISLLLEHSQKKIKELRW